MDNEVEHIIDRQYSELMSGFKPVFGNERHIQIREFAEEIAKKEKLLKQKLDNAKGAEKIQEELSFLKRRALFILKNQDASAR